MKGLIAQLPPPPSGRLGWPWTEETNLEHYRSAPSGGWPKISIVCPSFQQGRFIEEAIRSVLLQNYPALEFIVMDGGSDDETVPILQKYAVWLTHWESQPDHGQAHALNKGFAKATGEIFGWINSDDYYLPGAFATVGRAARVGHDVLWSGNYDDLIGEPPELRRVHNLPALAFQVAVGGRTLPSHATFWHRTIHQQFDETLQFTLDAELFKRFGRCGIRPRHLAQSLAVFRRHPDAKTSTLAAVAKSETHAWFATCPWYYPWLYRLSRLIDRLRRLLHDDK
ncbi:MAG: glycosyltransferase family 2 protein [Opitutaceae bacterium]|nr:glycosyltransferase family 2 protein [Opitutaceae bacterium]